MSANDELVSQFIAFTGCSDPERAQSYLEMSGGNVETAVGLYMEHQPGSVGAAGAGGAAGMMEDAVRAPDATQSMRLMDDHSGHHGMFNQMMDPMIQQQLASNAFGETSLFGNVRDAVNAAAAAGDDDDDDDDDSDHNENDDMDDMVPKAPSAARLADMFAAPKHLIFDEGGFEGARNMARDNKRWLLVNLQRDNEFSCHALNRDVWRDELVENLIREGFVFWQSMDISPDGQVYAQRYHVHDFPHIAIIDPRTRRLLWKKEGWTQQNPMTSALFAETAMDFCSRYSFDKPPAAPRPPKKSVQDLPEEDQLQAAMRASLQGNAAAGNDDDDDDDDMDMEEDYEYNDGDSDVDDDNANAADEAAAAENSAETDSKPSATEEAKPASLIDELLKMDVPDEPASGARIQLRLPNGKRVVRKFNPSDTVRTVYLVCVHSNEEAKGGKDFKLMAGFPPKDLIDDVDATVEACKLSGEVITMRWK